MPQKPDMNYHQLCVNKGASEERPDNVLVFAWKQLHSDILFVDSAGNKSMDSFLWAIKRKMPYPGDILGGENTRWVWENKGPEWKKRQALANKEKSFIEKKCHSFDSCSHEIINTNTAAYINKTWRLQANAYKT